MATDGPALKSRGKGGVEMTEVIEQDHRPWWLRLRSAFLLTLLVVALGLAAAVLIGVAALALSQMFSQALG